jgi:hypothetical protein
VRNFALLAALVAAAVVAVTITSGRSDAASAACGVERWAVKTLQDDLGQGARPVGDPEDDGERTSKRGRAPRP